MEGGLAIALVAKRDRLGRHEFKRREQLAGRAPDEHKQVGERSAFRQLQLFGRTSRRQGSKTQHGDTNGAERSFASSAETEWQQQTGTGSGVLRPTLRVGRPKHRDPAIYPA